MDRRHCHRRHCVTFCLLHRLSPSPTLPASVAIPELNATLPQLPAKPSSGLVPVLSQRGSTSKQTSRFPPQPLLSTFTHPPTWYDYQPRPTCLRTSSTTHVIRRATRWLLGGAADIVNVRGARARCDIPRHP